MINTPQEAPLVDQASHIVDQDSLQENKSPNTSFMSQDGTLALNHQNSAKSERFPDLKRNESIRKKYVKKRLTGFTEELVSTDEYILHYNCSNRHLFTL